MTLIDKPINSALPIQMVPYKIKFLKDKDKNGCTKFMKDCMDALESIGRYSVYNNIQLKKNYDIMSGRFNVEDYIDNFDTYDLSTMIYQEMKLPSFLKHYDITSKAVKLLLGEFLKRPDITRVVAKDPQTSNEKLRIKSDLTWQFMKESINTEITNKLVAQGIDPNRDEFQNDEEEAQYKEAIQQKYQELTPQSIEKYLTYDFRSDGEHWGQATLSDDIERFRIREQDITGFSNMCIVDRTYDHIYLTPSGYAIESWNPITIFQQYTTQQKNTEDLVFAGRILYMSKTEIVSYLGWRMTADQMESLYPNYQKGDSQGSVYKEAFHATMYPFADYREFSTLAEGVGLGFMGGTLLDNQAVTPNTFGSTGAGVWGDGYSFAQADIVQVTQAYWKSQRKVGKVNLQNPETGEVVTQIVDEFFEPKLLGIEEVKDTFKDSDEPNTVCWTWIPEVWQGVKINVNYDNFQNSDERNAIYVDIKPCEFQFRGSDPRLIYNSKLPIIGTIFNNYNGRSQSVVDLLKPYQVLCNAFYNQAYHVAQKNNGKFFLMGASLLPSVKDWGGEESQEKFMTIVQNLGLGVVDDSTSAQAQSMQYGLKVLDMDESERITRLINLAMLIEQQGFMQLGITPQRQGQMQASSTASSDQAAIQTSYAITDIYFEQYSNHRRRKFQALLEMAQYVESKGEGDIVKQYTTSDLGQAFIRVASSDLLLIDIGVYIMNSSEQQRKKELVEQLLLKNNQSLMPLSKLIETIRLDSLADVQKKLEEQESQAQQAAQQAEKAKMEHEQQLVQMQMDEKEKDRQLKKYEIDVKAKTEIDKVALQGVANEGSFDQEGNTLDQLMAQKDIALREQDLNSKNYLAQQALINQQLESYRKEKSEKEKQLADSKLKDKEHKLKKDVETSKLSQIKEQNQSQEKVSREAHEAKMKELKEKAKSDKELADKALELKNKDLEIKKLDVQLAKEKADLEKKQMEDKIALEREMGEAKADAVVTVAEAKKKEAEALAKIKAKEAEQQAKLKMEQNVQTHEQKLEQNDETHSMKLKEDKEKHKMNLKKIKIKPKIKNK